MWPKKIAITSNRQQTFHKKKDRLKKLNEFLDIGAIMSFALLLNIPIHYN